ncbi:response regulator [Paenibacillus sp. SI8]|uniref:response regulator n=1 Tax=unclassified Paenibacillus TaxID=185978 RepID=UPI003467D77E
MKESYKILIVDDHPMVSFGTKGVLDQIDNVFVVGIASTGEACMKYVVEYTPNLVLLDYNLPDQSGYELTKQINSLNADIQVVIFTGIHFM